LHDDDDDHVYGEEILVQRKPVVYNGGLPFQQQHTSVDYGHQTYGLPGHVHPRVNTMVMARNTVPAAPARIQTGSPGGFVNRQAFPTPDVGLATQNPSGVQQQSADLGFDVEQQQLPTSPGGTTSWVQPGDLAGLKKQLVRLLNQNSGSMTVVKVPAEYNKVFGRPLYLAEYNVLKLVHLLEKMKDTLVVKGEGASRTLHLKSRNKYKPSGNKTSSLPKGDKDR
jgi:hypothetical protein